MRPAIRLRSAAPISPAQHAVRGSIARFKRLLIGHALSQGFQRIEFRVDARNLRSQAAVEKLGATREGLLRRNRKIWTGYVRDTACFSILADEWQAR